MKYKMNLQLFGEETIPDDVILPDDFEVAQPQAETEPQTETMPTEPDYSPFLNTLSEKVKYNHQPVKVESFDDVVANYQKGLNYDKLQEKFNSIQSDPRISKADKLGQVSKMLGYQTDDSLLDALFESYYEDVAQKQGLTPEQVKKDYELQQREQEFNKKQQTEQEKQKENEMYDKFNKTFPDVKPEDIKPETWTKVNEGMDLTAAYIEQRNQELENRIKVFEQNEKNKKQAPVSGVTQHGGTDSAPDPIFTGFDD